MVPEQFRFAGSAGNPAAQSRRDEFHESPVPRVPSSTSPILVGDSQELVLAGHFGCRLSRAALYRRFAIGRLLKPSNALRSVGRPQNAILRYSGLKICATGCY